MKILDVVTILVGASYAGLSVPRRRWLDVAVGLAFVLAPALDLAGIGGPRL